MYTPLSQVTFKLPTLPTLLLSYEMPLYSPYLLLICFGYARSSALYDIFRFVASSAALLYHISTFHTSLRGLSTDLYCTYLPTY